MKFLDRLRELPPQIKQLLGASFALTAWGLLFAVVGILFFGLAGGVRF